jgi:hypothetical protein
MRHLVERLHLGIAAACREQKIYRNHLEWDYAATFCRSLGLIYEGQEVNDHTTEQTMDGVCKRLIITAD